MSLGGGKIEALRASKKTFSEMSLEERDGLVLALLAEADGGLKPGDLCAKVCGDVAGDPRVFGTLGSTLKRLRKAGKVDLSGRRWSITDAGKEPIDAGEPHPKPPPSGFAGSADGSPVPGEDDETGVDA